MFRNLRWNAFPHLDCARGTIPMLAWIKKTKGEMSDDRKTATGRKVWDHSSHREFFDYYTKASQSNTTLQRFASIRELILRLYAERGESNPILDVADIGCGAGTQSLMWAQMGHHVHGLDINAPLVEVAKTRASEAGYTVDFRVGSAVSLPWPDASMDVCILPELLEHVSEWEECLKEASRILKPGGFLYVSTSSKLCPIQQEFSLPLYSWYPGFLKKHCVKLALTSRPQLVNYAKYPAVNWFTYYQLRRVLRSWGYVSKDRFDLVDLSKKGVLARLVIQVVRTVPLVRWLGHVATPYTVLVAEKCGR